MSLYAEYFALTSGVSSLSEIDFFTDPNMTGMVSELDTYRSNGSLWEGGPSDDFAARYTGNLNVTKAGTYTLFLTSDDGSALYIDGQPVIDNDGLHAAREQRVTLDLSAGAHEIEIRYFERGWDSTLQLEWEGPDSNGQREVISGDAFSHGTTDDGHDGHDEPDTDDGSHGDHGDGTDTGDKGGHDGHDTGDQGTGGHSSMPGLLGAYFVMGSGISSLSQIDFDATPNETGMVSELDTYRSSGSLWEGGPSDDFAARYTGNLNVAEAGTYTLFLTSDDGSALYIDGQPVIDNDGLHADREQRVTLDLSAGAHEIEIQYFERGGRSTLQLEWEGPDSNGQREVISGDAFSHGTTDDGHDGHDEPDTDDGSHGDHGDGTDTGDNGGHDGHDTGDQGTGGHSSMPGLLGAYFVMGSGISSLSQIDFNATPDGTGMVSELDTYRSNGSLWEGGPSDDFAARYTGNLNVAEAGIYTLYLTSDDGSALYIDGQPVIDNDGLHWFEEQRVTLDLSAGTHEIEVRYFERGGEATLQLEWEGPDSNGQREVISGEAFSHGDMSDDHSGHDTGDTDGDNGHGTGDHGSNSEEMPGLIGAYFILAAGISSLSQIDFDATPYGTGTATELNTVRSGGSLWEGGPSDNFAVQYTGNLNVAEGGTYTLYLTSDDGSALYIDGQPVIDNDGLHATEEQSITLDLSTGTHEIEVRYFEAGGASTLQLEWEGPDSNGQRELISGNTLTHSASGDQDTDYGNDGHDGHDTDDGQGTGDSSGHDGHDTDDGQDPGGHDGHDSGDHGGHSDGYIPPPTDPSEVDAYVAAVKALPDAHAHGDNAGMSQEHMQVLDLVDRAEATHVAIGDGDWFDPATWHNGIIPEEGAKVLIPEGISVLYDEESDESLFSVRVDGELAFATNVNSKILLDTMVVSPTGRLEIGTADNPVEAGVDVQIVIANNGDINTSWDPSLLSRGVISHGEVEINGAEKTSFLKVSDAPMAGDTQISLAEVPEGWEIGDTIVLSGTHKQGWYWDNDVRATIYHESEDEEVVITAIDGNTITLDRALQYDHDTPRDDLSAYVANMSRNITFSSEDGEGTEVHHRGHVMFMHSDDVDVRYAAFDDLGRTDKSTPAADVGTFSSIEPDSNVKGRYSFHFHKTGTENQEDPAIAIGNTVSGSPGWGFVHHSSHAYFTDNVAFDVFGAAFAAEDGDETGIWSHNMAIRSEGVGWGDWAVKEQSDLPRHDNGRTGDGFFFAGRLVEASDNVAVNTTHGYVWMHRSAPTDPLSANLDQPEIAYGSGSIQVDQAPIQGFHNNEAFGTEVGLIVVKANPSQGHDVRSVFDGFLNWETSRGVDLSYTAHYTLLDVDLVGAAGAEKAFNLGGNAFDVIVNGLTIDGFNEGVNLEQSFHFGTNGADYADVFIDVSMQDVAVEYVGFNSARHTVMSSDQLVADRLGFVMHGDNVISEGEALRLDGIKTDSIGSRDRQFEGDNQVLEWHQDIAAYIANVGYYKTESGENVIILEDFVADRATGELYKLSHVIELDMTDTQIQNSWSINHWGGAQFNGTITFDGIAPETQDDSASTAAGQDILIDVLANDSHLAGDTLHVDGLSTTPNGNIYVQDDGQVLYRPNPDFVGTDTFSYWAADDDGQYSEGLVTVDVWSL